MEAGVPSPDAVLEMRRSEYSVRNLTQQVAEPDVKRTRTGTRNGYCATTYWFDLRGENLRIFKDRSADIGP